MRRIIAALMGTVSGLVMLFSYHTSTNTVAAPAGDSTSDGGATAGSPDTGSVASGSGSADQGAAATDSAPAASGTYTGDAVQTRYGPVQVQITVENGVMTSADAVQYPDRDRRDQQINGYAVPVLNAAAVDAQSAQIDGVSGATFTSMGYVQSLQSAIDEAFQ